MLTTIFFDLDDTLLWDKQSIKTAFEETCKLVPEVPSDQLEAAVRSEATKRYQSYATYPFTQQIGINPFEGLWGIFDDPGENFQAMKRLMPTYQVDSWTAGLKVCDIKNPELGAKLAERFVAERKKHPLIFADTLQVLSKLSSNFQLLLLTNGSPSLQQTKLSISPEIAAFFKHVVISGDVGYGKPDKRIFDFALSQAKVPAEEVLMVGDNLMTDILGANRASIKNIWINHHQLQTDSVQPTYEVPSLAEILPIIASLSTDY